MKIDRYMPAWKSNHAKGWQMNKFELAVLDRVGNGLAWDTAHLKLRYTPRALLELSEIYAEQFQDPVSDMQEMGDILHNDYTRLIMDYQQSFIGCSCPAEIDPYGTGDSWLKVTEHTCHPQQDSKPAEQDSRAEFEAWWDSGDDIANSGPWEADTPIQFAYAEPLTA